ncbi:MAG: ATP synthase F1 subunit gamma, partial [Hyphomicrobiales bacterium]
LARARIRELNAAGKTVKILCVGKKGYDALKREFAKQILPDVVDLRRFKNIGFESAQAIGKTIISMFEAGEFDVCSLFFSRFESVMSQVPTEQQIVPLEAPAGTEDGVSNSAVYDYEPSEEEILGDLLPRNLSVQVFRALLENAASEQGARMSAMDNATRNAGEMIDKLTMSYNRQRQAQITKELIEIISGAEAL